MEDMVVKIDLNEGPVSGHKRAKEGSWIPNDIFEAVGNANKLEIEQPNGPGSPQKIDIVCFSNEGITRSSSYSFSEEPSSDAGSNALEDAWSRTFEFEAPRSADRNGGEESVHMQLFSIAEEQGNTVASKENANAATPAIISAPIQVECPPLPLPPLPASSAEVKDREKNAEIGAQTPGKKKPPPVPNSLISPRRASIKSSSSPRRVSTRDPFTSSSRRAAKTTATKEEEEEDPFKFVDLPEKYRKRRCGFWGIFQWFALFVSIGFLVCSLTLNQLKSRSLWGLELWKWAITVFVVFCGRLVSGWLIHIVVFFVEKNFMMRKRVVYFVYGLQKGVQSCLWLAFILLTWSLLFNPKAERSTGHRKVLTYVTKLIVCFLIAAVLWLIKLLGLKVLAMNYHVSNYFERIQEALFHQHILHTLSGPPLVVESSSDEDEKKVILDPKKNVASPGPKEAKDAITIERLQKLNTKNVSAWSMKRLMIKIKQQGLSTLSQSIDDSETDEENAIKSELEAKIVAKQIFRNVAEPGSRYITIADLKKFLPDEEAERAFPLFDGATDHGNITKKCLINWVINVYNERKSLALSLNDTQTAVHKLHQVVNVLLIILIIVISLIVLGIATTSVLVVISGQLLLVVFIFGNTCKTVFEAIIFIFVMHPYDIGDRCVIDGVQMTVDEMNIMTTVFLRFDNERIYYPNATLATKPISNFHRSPDMNDAVNFAVHISTSNDQIVKLKAKLQRYLENNAHRWRSKFALNVKEIEDMNKMKMSIWLQHASNHQNAGERNARISDLILELRAYCQELGIEYHLPAQEIQLSTADSDKLRSHI